jgi:hypothetical protein
MIGGQGRREPAARWSMRKIAGPVIVVAVAALALTGCSASDATDAAQVAIDRNPITELIKPKLLSPVKDGEVGVSPGVPMAFKVEDGKFTDVTLTSPQGKSVNGRLAAEPDRVGLQTVGLPVAQYLGGLPRPPVGGANWATGRPTV